MTDVFYRGLTWALGSLQATLEPALADKARMNDVRKTSLKRALTAWFSTISCAGHVLEEGWKGFLASYVEPQTAFPEALATSLIWPASCAGHVLGLLASKSTVLENGGLL